MAKSIPIVIEKGRLLAVYDDRLLPYIERLKVEFGLPDDAVEIFRASHVEPASGWMVANWGVDLAPVGGPCVYADEEGIPFETRKAALAFERRWLIEHWLKIGESQGRSVTTDADRETT